MALEKEDGAVEKLMEEGQKQVGSAGDKYDELKELEVSDHNVEAAYAGMGKEELMKYANSPFWVRLRWLLFVTFWLSWFAMMFGALFIIFMTPKCFPSSKLQWYQKSPVYVIDTSLLLNKDGLDEKIEYMNKLGVQNVVLTSVFKSNDGDDIDFVKNNVTSVNGTSVKDFIKKLKDKDMKVMLKLVPNYSSTSNMFFVRSQMNEPYFRDYYIWNPGFSNGDKHTPINNWLNVTGGPAWKWSEPRKEFYLHQFSENKPDFNFRNKYVVDYFEEMFEFWLSAGIDGFYLDEVQYLFVDKDFKNHTDMLTQTVTSKYNSLSDKITSNLPETFDLISRWGKLIRNNSGILIVSDLDPKDVTEVDMVHSPVTLTSDFTGEQLLNAISSKKNTPSSWSSWEWVCTDVKPNCWEREMLDAFSILGSLLPGTPFINADPKLFEDNHLPNITLIESTLKELRSMPTVEFGSLNAKLLNNDTVFVFDRVMSGSESLLFAWNLSKNVTVLDLTSFDGTPAEVKLSLCTSSACSILPAVNSNVDGTKLNLAAESAVVVTF